MVIGLKVLIFTLFVPGTVVAWAPWWLLASRPDGLTPGLGGTAAVAVVAMIAGAAVYAWCAWDFAVAGRGTPAPIDPPRRLVVRGLYRHVRNPMYVGVTTILIGEVLLFRSRALFTYALLVMLGFHLFVVLYEEPSLRRRFGGSYDDYCRSVRRWLPRLTDPIDRA